MKLKEPFMSLVGVLILVTSAFPGDYYRLRNVKRVDQDLYSAEAGFRSIYIETQYCYHNAYGEAATLKYDSFTFDNKIIWQDESSCQVKRIWAK